VGGGAVEGAGRWVMHVRTGVACEGSDMRLRVVMGRFV